VRCLEYELLGGAVEGGGSLQCFGGGDSEVVQDVLDGPGRFMAGRGRAAGSGA